MNGDSLSGIGQRLIFRVQQLPRYVHLIMMLVGALAGYIFASYTGRSVKVCVFWGATIGLVSLFLMVFVIEIVASLVFCIVLFLVVYNLFFVFLGKPMRLPEVAKPGYWFPPDTPLANAQIRVGMWPTFLPSLTKIPDPAIRAAVEKDLDRFLKNGYQLIRCNYARMPEGNPFPFCDFWYERSPVGLRDFPQLPPAPIAVVHDFAIAACPPTKREADELWRRVTRDSRGSCDMAPNWPLPHQRSR